MLLIAVIAFFYASVGHGGASGYLALMSLCSLQPAEMRSSALVLNILVSGIAFYQFYRSGNFRWKLFRPFAILSVPMSFLGAGITLNSKVYHVILGLCLLVAALRIMGVIKERHEKTTVTVNFVVALLIGSCIGFISGLIGIGGGVLLSPVLLLSGWAGLREAAAVSALFILVNSTAGLAGAAVHGITFMPQMYGWIFAAAAGGIAGSYLGSQYFNKVALRYILSAVLLLASIKLFII